MKPFFSCFVAPRTAFFHRQSQTSKFLLYGNHFFSDALVPEHNPKLDLAQPVTTEAEVKQGGLFSSDEEETHPLTT